MRIEDVVNSLNRLIAAERVNKGIKSRAFLILHKQVTPDTNYPAYKDFSWKLYYVDDDKKYRLITVNIKNRATTELETNAISLNGDVELCTKLFEWKGTHQYDQVVAGLYKEEEI